MKVKRMIQELSKFNPKAEVVLHSWAGLPAIFAIGRVDNDELVVIECEKDIDLKHHLINRFDDARINNEDKLSLYTDLIEHGITIENVRKYIGQEEASFMESLLSKMDY